MNWILDRVLRERLKQETRRYLQELARLPVLASRKAAMELVARLRAEPGPKTILGQTLWDEGLAVPLDRILRAIGLVTGGMGSGKTRLALLIVKCLIDLLPYEQRIGFGEVDPKGELYHGTLFLLMERLKHLTEHDPPAAKELRRRIVLYDFSSRDPVSPFNILARPPTVEPDFFAWSRAELLLDLLPGGEQISLGGVGLLQKLILLLSELDWPSTRLGEVLHNEQLRSSLVAACRNPAVSSYFMRQFDGIPKPTIAALARRMDALLASEGVRLSLSGNTSPDLTRIQDHGQIALFNCFGKNISRGVRRLLQGLVLSDIRQSVFARERKDVSYLWICDEAQNFFLTEKLRDNMTELLTTSRSFMSYFLFMTQNSSTAIQDPRLLRLLHTNMRWSFSMRGDPGDCAFLKPVLPVTGRLARPQSDPFAEKSFYSVPEERAIRLDAISHLPDRVGYLWLKSGSSEALKIKTEELCIPQGEELEAATLPLRRDPAIGARVSRKEYEHRIAERDRKFGEAGGDVGEALKQAYRRRRGK